MSRSAAPSRNPSAQRTLRWHGRRARGAEVLRREGGLRLLARAAVEARSIVYRSVVILRRDLSESVPELGTAPVEIRLLATRDEDALRRHRVDLEPSRISARLDRLGNGHACVVAWLAQEIVASAWLAFDEARIPEIGRTLRLGSGEVFGYDSYTREGVRGRAIATARALWTARWLRDEGYDFVIAHVAPENRPAHGPPARAGYQELGTAGYVGLGPWRRNFVRPTGREHRWSGRRSAPIDVASDFVGIAPVTERATALGSVSR